MILSCWQLWYNLQRILNQEALHSFTVRIRKIWTVESVINRCGKYNVLPLFLLIYSFEKGKEIHQWQPTAESTDSKGNKGSSFAAGGKVNFLAHRPVFTQEMSLGNRKGLYTNKNKSSSFYTNLSFSGYFILGLLAWHSSNQIQQAIFINNICPQGCCLII